MTLPLLSASAAEMFALSPTLICDLSLRTSRRRAVGETMNVAASDFPSIDAVIVAEPARFATAMPLFTVAIAGSDDVHVMTGDWIGAPTASSTVAVNVCDSPIAETL